MTIFPSIRQVRRLVEEGMWHTPADSLPGDVQPALKPTVDALFPTCNTLSGKCLKLFSGRNSGRRRRRSMARTYVILAFGLGLGACSQAEYRAAQSRILPMTVKTPPVAAPFIPCTETPAGHPGHDRVWATCMTMHKPTGHTPAELLFTDWRGR